MRRVGRAGREGGVHGGLCGAEPGCGLGRNRKFSELAPHPLTLRAIFTADEWLGALVYRCSGERRRAALAASGDDADVMVPAMRAAAVAGVVGIAAAVLYARLSAD